MLAEPRFKGYPPRRAGVSLAQNRKVGMTTSSSIKPGILQRLNFRQRVQCIFVLTDGPPFDHVVMNLVSSIYCTTIIYGYEAWSQASLTPYVDLLHTHATTAKISLSILERNPMQHTRTLDT